jgi:Cytochrome c7 and related cytochrome c
MLPKTHKQEGFKTKTHGQQAATDLKKCIQCHNGMSSEELQGYGDASIIDTFLNEGTALAKPKNEYDYAKENTFCKACHSKRPASHDSKFFSTHGTAANKNQESCKACHDVKLSSGSTGNKVNCSTCHPSKHSQKPNWKQGHPISVEGVQKPTAKCYTCHAQKSCQACHKQ